MATEGEVTKFKEPTCPKCGEFVKFEVCFSPSPSPGNYFLGYQCPCYGPISRVSPFFKTREAVERELTRP